MESRLKCKAKQYEDAVSNFEESLSIDCKNFSSKIVDTIKSGRVQKFELCTELLWKTLKVYLWEVNGIDSKSPKSTIKDFYNLGFLSAEEYEKVMQMIDDRNNLSHIYNNDQFEEIYNRVILTLPLFKKVIGYLS
jgi:nucleotidyltransferase substrate binding protein (TIGR01987 family)